MTSCCTQKWRAGCTTTTLPKNRSSTTIRIFRRQTSPADHRFRNLWEIWLQGDHYKWRLMRANGVPEKYCTGDVPEYEKFLAWARTVPATLRSPLYVWTHLELKRYFGIGDLLNENNANRCLGTRELRYCKTET